MSENLINGETGFLNYTVNPFAVVITIKMAVEVISLIMELPLF